MTGDPTAGESEAEITRTTNAFFSHLDGTAEDPSDTLRQQRWLEAQEGSDARLRASLGGHAWMALHREANRPSPSSPTKVNTAPSAPPAPDAPAAAD